ncbi:hexapeptide transferase [Rhodovarius crocodyli]|uniref:Hexapeptide transferase n=1 Tax=Rhodovarius crocodyli TaxID=1979269 RepID=A0A437M3R2_9PROT|nr:hexapeptide transferase [Rhodovarius crocodyli]
MTRLVLIGAGGHAKVLIELWRALGTLELVGCLSDAEGPAGVLGVPVLGGTELLEVLRNEGVAHACVAVGDNGTRERLGAQATALGFALPAAIHPAALVSPSARIGAGAQVLARALVAADARVEGLALLNHGAILDHDAVLGAAAHAAPGSSLAGGVRVGARALIGVGAQVKPGVSIGADAVVGVGAAVIADVPPGATVTGVPAQERSF